jgi:hypothetical protein
MTIVAGLLVLVSVTALLIWFLIKMSDWVAARVPDPSKRVGGSIDVAKLKPRVEDVRRDYLAARRSPRGQSFRTALLRLARRAVAHLGYFCRRAPEADVHTKGL